MSLMQYESSHLAAPQILRGWALKLRPDSIAALPNGSRRTATVRNAVTLVEVVFSIGVILIGLLGLLSILPLAGNRAQEAVSLSVGASVADGVIKEIQTRHFVEQTGLVDFASDEGLKYERQLTAGPALTLTSPDPDPNNHPVVSSVCIDPMYVAEQGGTVSTTDNGYLDATFPYYEIRHDPLLNPSLLGSGSEKWPSDQPRMRRFGFRDPSDMIRPFTFAGLELVRSLVESSNDLIVTRPQDRSEEARFFGLRAAGLEYGRRVPSGEYSWIATISPLPGTAYASVSVVVIRNRVRQRDFLAVFTDDPKDNALSERLAYVTAAYGFRGGAGGTVHLTASATTSPSLHSGNWVMLSRRVSVAPIVDVHRWYRVAAVDGDADVFVPASNTLLEANGAALPDPGVARSSVWRHKVLLDGPDWSFGFPTPGAADATEADNTYATIFSDVISVTERVIPLADL